MSTKQNATTFPFENLPDVTLSGGGEGSITIPGEPIHSVTIHAATTRVELAFADAPTVGFPIAANTSITLTNKNLAGQTLFFINGTDANLVKVLVEHGIAN